MANSRAEGVLGHLQHWLRSTATPADDGPLLERFVRQRDEAAFAELVARHGPLVFGLCRRVLGNVQDAEDVFQAAFLVLARKAATIRKPQSLSCWLHGVAYRLALKARAEAERRRVHERQAAPSADSAETDLSWREVRGLIDEELQRLPEKQRLPLVLCYLEGLTQDEAARRLGWPRGTLKRRLEAGRERLRLRLTRRGVTLGAGLFAAALTESATRGAVPLVLRNATTQAGMQFLTNETAALAVTPAALLAKGALQSMLTTKLKLGAMLLLLFGCAVTAAGLAIPQAPKEQPPEKKAKASAPSPAANDKQVRKDRNGDPLPEGAIARLGTLRLRHSNATSDAVFTPDGKTVIVSDRGGEVIVWDVATGREVRRLPHIRAFNALPLAITADGKTLVCGGAELLSRWDVATGKLLSQTQTNVSEIWQLLITPDGKTLIFHDATTIFLWDAVANKKLHELKGHKGHVTRLALSPDGKILASTSWEDGNIHLWEIASGKEKARIAAQEKTILYIAFSPDGKSLASWGNLGFWVFDTASGKKIRELPADSWCFAYFPDGKRIAALGIDGKVHIHDARTGKHLREYDSPSARAVVSSGDDQTLARLVISPDGKTVATLGGGSMTFDLGDAQRGKLLHSFAGHRSNIAGLGFAADGRTLFSSAANQEAVLAWDAATGELRGQLVRRIFFSKEEDGGGKALALSPDGKLLAAGSHVLILWDADSRKEVRRCIGPKEIIVSAAWSVDGKTLVSTSQERKIRVWDPATGKQRRMIESKLHVFGVVALSPDGATIAAGSPGRGTIYLWAADTGKELRPIVTSQGIVSSLAFSPHGSILVSGGSEGGMCFSEPTTGRVLRRWDSKPGSIGCLVFSRDGRTLVSGHGDSSVHVWEVASGRERACFQGHRGAVGAAAFSRDGRRIASGSSDTTILVWDVTGGARRDAALSPQQLQTLWRDLRDTDAGRAYRALWRMALTPKQALPFLVEQLRPAAPLDADRHKQVDRLLADLDSKRFEVRQDAETKLEKMGLMIEPALHKALEIKPSLEVRQRIEKVLEKMASERLRILRALEAIEHMNMPEARRLVESLAKGAPRAWLTEEAATIRQRWTEASHTAPER